MDHEKHLRNKWLYKRRRDRAIAFAIDSVFNHDDEESARVCCHIAEMNDRLLRRAYFEELREFDASIGWGPE